MLFTPIACELNDNLDRDDEHTSKLINIVVI